MNSHVVEGGLTVESKPFEPKPFDLKEFERYQSMCPIPGTGVPTEPPAFVQVAQWVIEYGNNAELIKVATKIIKGYLESHLPRESGT